MSLIELPVHIFRNILTGMYPRLFPINFAIISRMLQPMIFVALRYMYYMYAYSYENTRKTWNTDIILCQNLIPEFEANFLFFWHLYGLVFYLKTIGVWLLAFEKNPFQFWREIWNQVVVLLIKQYIYRKLVPPSRCCFLRRS